MPGLKHLPAMIRSRLRKRILADYVNIILDPSGDDPTPKKKKRINIQPLTKTGSERRKRTGTGSDPVKYPDPT